MEASVRGANPTLSALAVLGLLAVLLPSAVLAAYLLPSPVALMAAGPVEPVDALLRVEGASYQSEGHLYLATVRLEVEPRLGQYLLAQLQADVQEVPKGEALPADLGREEYEKLSQRLLAESQGVAQLVALRQAGYTIKTPDASVQVVSTIAGTPAAEQLQPGDVIEAADGEPIRAAVELVSIVQGRLSGEPVALRIRRNRKPLTVTLPALRGPLDSEGPVLGLVAVTSGFDYRSPVNVTFEPGAVPGGPSAALMYALGVYNAVVTEDITRGRKIAGTGTLRLNGAIGPVGGIQLKVRAAEDAGAEYFLVPAEDAAVARAAAQEMKIIPVTDFKGALDALRQIGTEGGSGPRVVPAGQDTILACLRVPALRRLQDNP